MRPESDSCGTGGHRRARMRNYTGTLFVHEYTEKYKNTIKQTKSIASERRDALPDSDEREATQMCEDDKNTGTEVGGEPDASSHRKEPNPGSSGREAQNGMDFRRQITVTESRWVKAKSLYQTLTKMLFCHPNFCLHSPKSLSLQSPQFTSFTLFVFQTVGGLAGDAVTLIESILQTTRPTSNATLALSEMSVAIQRQNGN